MVVVVSVPNGGSQRWFRLSPVPVLPPGSDGLCGFPQARLQSQELGKHLQAVDELLQLHALVEADIAAQAERVRAVSSAAQRFARPTEGERGLGGSGGALGGHQGAAHFIVRELF